MPQRPLTTDELTERVESGDVDTVLVVFTDMQGRLQGKRVHARFFLDEVASHGIEGCNYLLAVDVDMNTVYGYAMSSWERGYGDFVIAPDMSTLRAVPWLPGSVMVQCDLSGWTARRSRSRPARCSGQVDEARPSSGLQALGGTELEFIVFDDSYEAAWDAGYQGLTPANRYNVDYSILGTSRVEPLLRDIRNAHVRRRV